MKVVGSVSIEFGDGISTDNVGLDAMVLEELLSELQLLMEDKNSTLCSRIALDSLADNDIKYLNSEGADAIREVSRLSFGIPNKRFLLGSE